MEKRILTRTAQACHDVRPSPRRPAGLWMGVSVLGAMLLSACGTPVKTSASRLDMDTLLYTAPTAAGAPSTNSSRYASRLPSTQDPTSGLRVDIGSAALEQPVEALTPPVSLNPVALVSTVTPTPAATATSKPDVPAAAPAAKATTTAEQPAAAQAIDAENQDEGKTAIGAISDPLSPDATVDLNDNQANQDLWGRVRSGFALPDLDSPLVGDHERWYASRPDYVARMTDRSSRYLFHVVDEIQRRNMPTELALLPFIESAFNPQAMSSARASGIWQFMPATGKTFELKQNMFRDDRRDVLASTRAALDYLQRLYRQFGDWNLALAAYNWGEGNVARAIARNQRAGLPTDYLSLNMPPETRNYVPKLHAVKRIIARPEAYGLTLTPIENHPYFVSVPLKRDIDATLASRLAALSLDEFKALNPSLNKPVILAAGTPQVLLPYDNAGLFVRNLSDHKGPLASWTAWVVPRTMRPADAAKQVGMSEASLKDVNHIPNKMLVKAGSTLLVPRAPHREQDVSEALADNAMMSLAPDLPPLRKVSARAAGKRDTVAAMARRLNVSAAQLAQWNHMSAGASLKPGQTLVAYVPQGRNARQTTASAGNARSSTSKRERDVVVAKSSPRPAAQRSVSPRARVPAAIRGGRVKVASSR